MFTLLTENLYTSIIIPCCNYIIHRLSTYQFQSVTKFKPKYVNAEISKAEECSDPIDQSHLSEGSPIFLGYANGFEQNTVTLDPSGDFSDGMKNGYLNAIYAITISDVNPDLCNAATYQAYVNLCRLLKVHIPFAHNLGKCCVCYGPNGKCTCYKFKFMYIQAIECTCRTGKYGVCVCDEFPEIFCDLDVIRHYQGIVVYELLSKLGIEGSEDQLEELVIIMFHDFRLTIITARRSDTRYDPSLIRILQRFRPP